MAPLLKYALSALCVLAISPVLAAPVQIGTALERRQGAGVGDALASDTDSGSGYAIEDAEDNTASNIDAAKAGQAPTTAVTPQGDTPKTPAARRQLDKISNGAGTVATSVGEGQVGGQAATLGDNVDSQTTNDSGEVGTQVGSDEEETLEAAGSDTP